VSEMSAAQEGKIERASKPSSSVFVDKSPFTEAI
jgi:hypothetical protein